MPEKIFTIPINEAFDHPEGCPLCRLKADLEEQILSSALGASMMEPDVRIRMNEEGFCPSHLDALYRRKNKLALGLILESRLDTLIKQCESIPRKEKKGLFQTKSGGKVSAGLLSASESCYACRKIRHTELRYFSNIAWLWETDAAFRKKLQEHESLCLRHAGQLLSCAEEELKPEAYNSLAEAVTVRLREALQNLRQDVTGFTVSFDHRNAGNPVPEAERTALERSLKLLR